MKSTLETYEQCNTMDKITKILMFDAIESLQKVSAKNAAIVHEKICLN